MQVPETYAWTHTCPWCQTPACPSYATDSSDGQGEDHGPAAYLKSVRWVADDRPTASLAAYIVVCPARGCHEFYVTASVVDLDEGDFMLGEGVEINPQIIWPANAGLPDGVRPPQAEVPKEISKLYQEAAQVLRISPRAGGALARLCMESVIKEVLVDEPTMKKPNSGRWRRLMDLIEFIKANPPLGFTAELVEDLTEVREVANVAAHADPANDLVDFKPSDIVSMLGIVYELCEIHYVAPARRAKRKARSAELLKRDSGS